MATLYWNDDPAKGGANDGDWNTVANWFTDANCTTAAGAKPTTSDSVVVLRNGPSANGGDEPTIVNLTADSVPTAINITVTGTATYTGTDNGPQNYSIITGNVSFSSGARLVSSTQVLGTATFSGGQLSDGASVTGTAIFTNGAENNGTVTGSATFSGGSINTGTVTVNATFNDTSYCTSSSAVNGVATFTASTFNLSSSVRHPWRGSLGSVVLSSPTQVTINVTSGDQFYPMDMTYYTFTGGLPIWAVSGGATIGDISQYGSASTIIKGHATFSSGTSLAGAIISGSAKFVGATHLYGTISGNTEYTSGSTAPGAPYGGHPDGPPSVAFGFTVTFTGGSYSQYFTANCPAVLDISSAEAQIDNGVNNTFNSTVTITYGKGVNGSSILGVV
jgi:hypothetical protein